jgi:hypothetical protein
MVSPKEKSEKLNKGKENKTPKFSDYSMNKKDSNFIEIIKK